MYAAGFSNGPSQALQCLAVEPAIVHGYMVVNGGTRAEWLPNDADETYLKSLMHAVYEPGKMASWIAPPNKGINNIPGDFQYVRV